jgi:hypothetical protein
VNTEHTYSIERKYREGWGVEIVAIWAGESDEPECDRISDIDVIVVRIHPDNGRTVGGVYCMAAGDNFYVPVENFRQLDDLSQDDTHDLRTRWFATEEGARAHAKFTEERWANPSPWESFVTLT